jgi:hypothetical protein
MSITPIDDYEVMYSANQFPPRIWLIHNDSFFGQLIFEADGTALPADSENGGFNLYYHLENYAHCIDLLRNEKPVYLLWDGPGGSNENGLMTTPEKVGEGEK